MSNVLINRESTCSSKDQKALPSEKNMAKSQIWFGFALLALLLVSALADDVVVLTDDSFEKEVGKDKAALVEFYAPWYGSILSVRSLSVDLSSYRF